MIKYINDGLPTPIFNAIVKSAGEYDYQGNGISVTRLIDSPYIFWLSKNFTVDVPASKALWSLFGSMVHEILSRDSSVATELRLKTTINGLELSGKCDVYEPEDKHIEDYKFIGWQSWKYNPEGKIEYQRQLNILRFIWEKNNMPVNNLKLHYLFRNLSEFDILKHDTPDKMVVTIEVPTIPDIEEYIKKRIELFRNIIEYNNEPQVCSLEERWGTRKYAVMKEGNTKATKVFEEFNDARAFAEDKGSNYKVEERNVDMVRCKAYCSYNSVCRFYQQHKYEITNDE